ncbi:hypothetical protein GYW75_02290 [Gilliamella sp. ESL0232]|nr:hypothetical protein [Gilliamella sp. ESL0232]NUE95222.1 hypothetical protein [Gilliamella sp. ESL0232]
MITRFRNRAIGKCYIINNEEDHNYVFYQTAKTLYDIADFVMLHDAVED